MKQEEEILNKYGKDSGMRVPEEYFRNLESCIMESLPPYVSGPKEVELTRWQRVRPYVYLAAMFCGIWLMMKLFHTVSEPMTLSLDNPPSAVVQLMEQDLYEPESINMPLSSGYDLEEEVIMNYDSFEEFEKDFQLAMN